MLSVYGGVLVIRQVYVVCDVYWFSTLRIKINAKNEKNVSFNLVDSFKKQSHLLPSMESFNSFSLDSNNFATCAA